MVCITFFTETVQKLQFGSPVAASSPLVAPPAAVSAAQPVHGKRDLDQLGVGRGLRYKYAYFFLNLGPIGFPRFGNFQFYTFIP